MSIAIANDGGALTRLGYSPQQLALIRQTVAKDCSPAEFDLFIQTAASYGLNPFRREIYAIVVNKNNPDKRQLVLVTGIDGFRRKAEESRDYSPADDEPEITYRDELKDPKTNPLGIEKAKVTVYKKGKPVVGIAYWDEFAPLRELWAPNGMTGKREPSGEFELDPSKSNWRKMARHMLAKCAEVQALRKGWPSTFSGLYAAEEMDQSTVVDLSPSEWAEKEGQDNRLARINHGKSIPVIWKIGDGIEMVKIGEIADRIVQHLNALHTSAEVRWWRDANAAGLRDFWAYAPGDALEVKKLVEQREQALDADENTIQY